MQRLVTFKPAYHKIHEDPKQNYGVGSVTCIMVLKGERGAVHFSFGTGIHLPETWQYWADRNLGKFDGRFLPHMGYDVGYHSPVPQFEGQQINHPTKMVKKEGYEINDDPSKTPGEKLKEFSENVSFEKVGTEPPGCDWLDGKPCYCDGSALRAEKFMDVLMREGSDKIWEMLEEEYKLLFETLE